MSMNISKSAIKYIPLIYTKTDIMKTLSLKLDLEVFDETEKIIMQLDKPRNRYINEALAFYNAINKRKIIANQLAFESKLVGMHSLEVLQEFENLQDDAIEIS